MTDTQTKTPKAITYKSLAQIALGIFIGIIATNTLQLRQEVTLFDDLLEKPIDTEEQAYINLPKWAKQ